MKPTSATGPPKPNVPSCSAYITSCPREYAGFDSIAAAGGGVFREASKKTLYLASAPNVGQALDAGGVLSGEAAESPKGESSKGPSANAMPQRAYAKGRPTNVRCRPIPV